MQRSVTKVFLKGMKKFPKDLKTRFFIPLRIHEFYAARSEKTVNVGRNDKCSFNKKKKTQLKKYLSLKYIHFELSKIVKINLSNTKF